MIQSEKIKLDEKDANFDAALAMAAGFLENAGIQGKDALHIRLLAEECLGMAKAMWENYDASFWLEAEGEECRICLSARTPMDAEKKEEILSISSYGHNAAAKGFMGKIGELIEDGLLSLGSAMKARPALSLMPGSRPQPGKGEGGDGYTWSLEEYRAKLSENKDKDDAAEEAWDELEKSIVANLAKDVVVGVRRDRVDLTIIESCRPAPIGTGKAEEKVQV